MRFRFRKSFPLLGRFLQGTVSKKGVSLNMRLGPLSRSWGTRGTSTTVDMPGTSGIFWRGEKRRRKLGEQEAAQLKSERSRSFWRNLSLAALLLEALVLWGRIHVHFGQDCGELTGHPHLTLIGWTAAAMAVVVLLDTQTQAVRRLKLFGVTLVLLYAQWALVFEHMISPSINCS